MTPLIGLLMMATIVTIVVATLSYQRRSGVVSGAGRGAPTSPVIPILLVVLLVIGALLVAFLLRRSG
jgi:uncharacterized membrane protein YidH (DUF202 family)